MCCWILVTSTFTGNLHLCSSEKLGYIFLSFHLFILFLLCSYLGLVPGPYWLCTISLFYGIDGGGLKDSAQICQYLGLFLIWNLLQLLQLHCLLLICEASPLLVFVSSAGNISYHFVGLISQRTQCSYLVTYCALCLVFEIWYNVESLCLGMYLGF